MKHEVQITLYVEAISEEHATEIAWKCLNKERISTLPILDVDVWGAEETEEETDAENIYNTPSITQSIKE